MQLQVGANQATVDGQSVSLDAPAQIIGGSTMVPLRFVGEALGAVVDWSELRQTVSIMTREEIDPPRAPVVPPLPTERPRPPVEKLRPPVEQPEKPLALSSDRSGLLGRVPISFTLTGPRGGNAFVQVPGVSDEVPMTESRPGVYTVKWQAPAENTVVQDTTAIAHLYVHGQDLLAQLPNDLTIDTVIPTIRPVCPGATGEIHSPRPDIMATLDDGAGPGIDPNSVRLYLDHADVTNRAKVNQYRVALYPDFELVPGPHEVEISTRDMAGNEGRTHWTFVIAPPRSEPSHVAWVAPREWSVGAAVNFNFQGPKGGDAYCDLGPHRGLVHLKESSSGRYTGSYSLQVGDNFDDEPVIVRIHAGATWMSFQADSHLRMRALPTVAPVILTPSMDRPSGDSIVITGRAAARSKVLIHVAYATTLYGRSKASGGLADVTAVAGNDGMFRTSSISLAVRGSAGTTFTINATSVGADGRKSPVATTHFRSH